MMKKLSSKLFGLCLCMLLCTNAFAEKADQNKPMNIEADQMVSDDVKQVTTFTGNVIMTKGTILVRASKAVIIQDPEGYRFITLYGSPAFLKQKLDGGPNIWMEGYGQKITFDNKDEIAKFFTNARVKRIENGKTVDDVTGEYIAYNSVTEYYSVHNTSEGVSQSGAGRVKAIIQPRENKTRK